MEIKKAILIDKDVHTQLKQHCVNKNIMIKHFIETIIKKEITRQNEKG